MKINVYYCNDCIHSYNSEFIPRVNEDIILYYYNEYVRFVVKNVEYHFKSEYDERRVNLEVLKRF